MNQIYHSIIGLTGSGKTSYLAALWHLLDAGEIETKLVLDKHVGDNKHLNDVVDAWRRCEKVKRTSIAGEASVSIHVVSPITGQKVVLAFPDLSGESFERQFTHRKCKASYVEAFEREGGIMLFINADRVQDGLSIVDMNSMLGEVAENPTDLTAIEEWSHKFVPEQVQLVELLQFIQRRPFMRRKRKIAVAVSAWDLIDSKTLTPEAWLCRELPFLYQYLDTNVHSYELSVYGVSAQGGDLTGQSRTALLEQLPSERIRCVGKGFDSHDLTEPIAWLTEDA